MNNYEDVPFEIYHKGGGEAPHRDGFLSTLILLAPGTEPRVLVIQNLTEDKQTNMKVILAHTIIGLRMT